MDASLRRLVLAILILSSVSPLLAAPTWVAGTFPRSEASDVPGVTQIRIAFGPALDARSVSPSQFLVMGEFRGAYPIATLSFDESSQTVILTTGKPFLPGEAVTVTVLRGLLSVNGDTMNTPFLWRFRSATVGGSGFFDDPLLSGRTDALAGQYLSAAASADFNGDGAVDFAVACTNPSLTASLIVVFFNNGDGTFSPGDSISPSPEVPWLNLGSMAAADFDRDGDVDLALEVWTSQGGGTNGVASIHLVRNDGKGHFTYIATGCPIQDGGNLTVADLNGDGYPDLILPEGYQIQLLQNDTKGLFSEQQVLNAALSTTSVTAADLDGDGCLDLAAAMITDSTIWLYHNNGDQGFSHFNTGEIRTVRTCRGVTAADLDGNGTTDVAGIAFENIPGQTQTLSVLLSDGNGGYRRSTYGDVAAQGTSLAPADFDGDGLPDLLGWASHGYSFSVFMDRGGGDFGGPQRIHQMGHSGSLGPDVFARDFNGDGSLDLLYCPGNSFGAAVLLNRPFGPTLKIDPDSLLFGRQAVGSSVARTVRFTNLGTSSPLVVRVESSLPAFFAVSPESVVVASRDSVAIQVTFAPLAVKDYAESLMVSSNDPSRPVMVIPLRGRGVVRAATAPVQICPPDGALKLPVPATFCWNPLTDMDAYRLRIYVSPDDIEGIVDTIVVGRTTCDVNSLPYKTTLYWVVAGINAAGKGPYSPRRLFTTCSAGPSSLTATLTGLNAVRLTWRRVRDTDLAGYYVYSDTGSAISRIDSTESDTTFVLRHLTAGREYFFHVTGHDSAYRETTFSPLALYPVELFDPSGNPFAGGSLSTPAWGDADGDGDLDLLLAGSWPGTIHETRIYRNDAGTFTNILSIPDGIVNSQAVWSDLNVDGSLDILHGNYTDSTGYYIDMSIQDSNGGWRFMKADPRLPGDIPTVLDADNDGDPDILPGVPAVIYRNDGTRAGDHWTFTPMDRQASFDLDARCAADLDNDGRMDFVSVGRAGIQVFHNDGGGEFSTMFSAPRRAFIGSQICGDFDQDGDQDFCVLDAARPASVRVYMNLAAEGTSGAFTSYAVPLSGTSTVSDGGVCVGDYDGDGKPDLFCWGHESGRPFSVVFLNTGVLSGQSVRFVPAQATAPVPVAGKAAWADVDGDGRLDLTVVGWGVVSNIYHNNSEGVLLPLLPPTALHANVLGDTVWLEWKPPAGDTTEGKTFNLYVQRSDGRFVFSPLSELYTGRRLVPEPGNASESRRWLAVLPGPGTYRWSVQSVDPAYRGSPFAPPDSFSITTTAAPLTPSPLPGAFALYQNYPNPFNPTTTVCYDLPQAAAITLRVYNTIGQEVITLIDGELRPAGRHSVRFDARNLASGVYFYRLSATPQTQSPAGARRPDGTPFVQTRSFILLR